MDARTLGQAAGVQVGTLNAWIQRGYIPGISADSRGRLRDFDIKTAVHVATMVELTRFGFGAPAASAAARMALAVSEPCCLFTYAYQEGPVGKVGEKFTFGFHHFDSEAKLPEALAEAAPDPVPSVYLIVNTQRITTRMQQAEEEWQRHRAARMDQGPRLSSRKHRHNLS